MAVSRNSLKKDKLGDIYLAHDESARLTTYKGKDSLERESSVQVSRCSVASHCKDSRSAFEDADSSLIDQRDQSSARHRSEHFCARVYTSSVAKT